MRVVEIFLFLKLQGREKENMQCVYGQNEDYVQGGGVLIVLDFVKRMDGRFWGRKKNTRTEKKRRIFQRGRDGLRMR